MGKIRVKIRKSQAIEEKTQKELDAVYPGYEELRKLSNGVTETLDEKKKKQKNCVSGNPNHSGKTGKFTSRSDASSWSLHNDDGNSDCTWGQSRSAVGTNQRRITQKDPKTGRCGRDKHDGSGKSKVRCRDGSEVWEENQEKVTLDKSSFDLLMKRIADQYEDHLLHIDEETDPKAAKIKSLCSRYGMKSFRHFLTAMNSWELAQKGDLFKKPK